MKHEKPATYSDKGSHHERSVYHNRVKDAAKHCTKMCDVCPIIADCGVIYDRQEADYQPGFSTQSYQSALRDGQSG